MNHLLGVCLPFECLLSAIVTPCTTFFRVQEGFPLQSHLTALLPWKVPGKGLAVLIVVCSYVPQPLLRDWHCLMQSPWDFPQRQNAFFSRAAWDKLFTELLQMTDA